MMQCSAVAAPASIGTTEPAQLAMPLVVDDPSVVMELIAEVDAILCEAVAPRRRRPAPPAVGCALCEPRRAGRSWGEVLPGRRQDQVHRVDAVQRSPPGVHPQLDDTVR